MKLLNLSKCMSLSQCPCDLAICNCVGSRFIFVGGELIFWASWETEKHKAELQSDYSSVTWVMSTARWCCSDILGLYRNLDRGLSIFSCQFRSQYRSQGRVPAKFLCALSQLEIIAPSLQGGEPTHQGTAQPAGRCPVSGAAGAW